MFLFGGEKHCFEREGRMPKLGFSVKQGCFTEKSVRHAIGAGYGSRTEVHRQSDGETTGPYRLSSAARVATRGVTGQKSAEAILAVSARRVER